MFKPQLAGPARAFLAPAEAAPDRHPRPDAGRRREPWIAGAALALVLAFQAWTALGVGSHPLFEGRQDDYYNLLLHGFLGGHLYLPVTPDPRLAAAADPYDPSRRPPGVSIVHDASYFRGHYYLYFGAAPVVTLLLPWHWVTGNDLPQTYAALFFTAAGYAVLAGLWLWLRRRYFPRSGAGVMVLGIAVLGLASMLHAVLRRTGFWEAAIAAGFCFFALALCAVNAALHSRRPAWWLGAAGLLFGLAAGSRPTYLFGGALLLVPLVNAWRRGDGWRGQALAAALGAAPIFGAILWYNAARFGNPFEFGQRYELNAANELHARHFSLGYMPFNAYVYLLAPAQWSRYFPFVQVIHSPAEPAGYYGVEYVYGLLTNLPFAGLAIFAPLAWRRRGPQESAPLRAFVQALAGSCLGVAGVLACWWCAAARYTVDFVPELMLLACLGLLALEGARRSRLRAPALALAGAAGAFSVFVGIMLSFQLHTLLRQSAPATFQRLARAFDTPVAWLESWTGTRYGPREIRLTFPRVHAGRIEPLVTTGWEFYSDHLFVQYRDPRHLRLGFDHLSHGRIWSRDLAIDYGGVHVLQVSMGSLWPPVAHPYFARRGRSQVNGMARRLRVVLDGMLVFDVPEEFYDASPEGTHFGFDPDGIYGRRFTGRILSNLPMPYQPPAPLDAAYGEVEMDVLMPAGAIGRSLPLVATGEKGMGDLLSIREVRPGWVRFLYDNWGSGLDRSAEVEMADSDTHTLRICLPSLLPPPASSAQSALFGSLLVEVDGRVAWVQHVLHHPAAPGEVYFGRNGIGASSSEGTFAGGIARIQRLGLPLADALAGGPVDFRLRLPQGLWGRSEPLVSTGTPGRADVLSIEYVDPGHARFLLDHWGAGLEASPLVPVDYAAIHDLEVRMPTLERLQPAGSAEFRSELTVSLDGAVAWRAAAEFYPAAPGSIALAANPAGASTCGPEFTGGLVALSRGR